jgi:hypothetical protein
MYGLAHRNDLADALVTDGVSGWQREPALRNRHIEVATRHYQWPDNGLIRGLDLGLGGLVPGVRTRLLEHQLPHGRSLL